MKLRERPSVQYWWERVRSLSAYFIIVVILFLAYKIINKIFYQRQESTSTTRTKVESGGVANIINNNNIVNDEQGLYIALTSEQATVGVFKKMTQNFRLSLGAGESYGGEAVAEVRGEVTF